MDASDGGFIWYELMTPDADAAGAFYRAVIGWSLGGRQQGEAGAKDYRMLRRSDGGMAGGVLGLSADMLRHGARPMWVPYLRVADVDAAVAALVADGAALLPYAGCASGAAARRARRRAGESDRWTRATVDSSGTN